MKKWIVVCVAICVNAAYAWELWQTPAALPPYWPGGVRDCTAIADLNGDGKQDLVVGCADTLVRVLSGADGTTLRTFSVGVDAFPEGSDVWCVTACPDLDGDGKAEIVAGTSGNMLFVIGSSGNEYWRVPTDGDVWCARLAGDVTGDGIPEVACGSSDNFVRMLDVKGMRVLWSKAVGGDVWDVAGGRDLSGDGKPDVIAGTGANALIAYNGVSGDQLWTFTTSSDVWRAVFADDIDGDGIADIVIGTATDHVMCLSGKPAGGGPGGGGRQLWPPQLAVDVHVVEVVPDYTGDGIREVAVGGNDDVFRLYNGASGAEIWTHTAEGAIKDAIVGPDIDKDGRADLIFCTEGSTVDAVSAADGTSFWTYHSELPGTFTSVAALDDLDGDGIADSAAGSMLGFASALPAVPKLPPESVIDFTCVATEVLGGAGVRLAWVDPAEATKIRISEVTESGLVVLGEVPAGVQQLDVVAAGPAILRDYTAVAIGINGESQRESCTATLTPPPVVEVTCIADIEGTVSAAWVLPDSGLRVLDSVKVYRDDVLYATLPPTVTSALLGTLPPGSHTVTVGVVWELWESPPYTCTLWVHDPTVDVAFRRGDNNGDGKFDISDAIKTLQYLFVGGVATCLEALNVNGDKAVDISDAVYLLGYLFAQKPPPVEPFTTCGVVPGAPCDSYPPTSCPQ